MSDYCRVTLVGNLRSDVQIVRMAGDPGQVVGVTTVCVARTVLRDGEPVQVTVPIPVEIHGAARAARVAQGFGAGSRILLDGYLDLRERRVGERCTTTADGQQTVAVVVPRNYLVVVVDTIFNADIPQ